MDKRNTRKKEYETTDKVVSFRLSEREYNEIERKKEMLKMNTLSEYIRAIVNEKEVKIKSVYKEDPQKIELIKELIYQIRKLGININQIAFGVNIGQEVPKDFYNDTTKMLQEITRNCKDVLSEIERDFEIKERL